MFLNRDLSGNEEAWTQFSVRVVQNHSGNGRSSVVPDNRIDILYTALNIENTVTYRDDNILSTSDIRKVFRVNVDINPH